MKRIALFLVSLLLLAVMAVSACADDLFEVIAPDGYKSLSYKIPVVYVMPENGYENSKSNTIAQKLTEAMKVEGVMDMLIVLPKFDKDDNPHAKMTELVAQIDEAYQGYVLSGSDYRAVVGTGVGGYLAYALGMLDEDGAVVEQSDFGFIGSINGKLVDHEWHDHYGDLLSKFEADYAVFESAHAEWEAKPEDSRGKEPEYTTFGNHFTYLDAPVGGQWTNLDGSSADIGIFFDTIGLAAAANEYTLRQIPEDEDLGDFQKESARRVLDRFTTWMASSLVNGTASMQKSALLASEKSGELQYSVTAGWGLYNFVKNYGTQIDVFVKVVDPDSGETLSREKVDSQFVFMGSSLSGMYNVPNIVKDNYSKIILSANVLGTEVELATAYLIRSTPSTSTSINLLGDWHFKFVGDNPMGKSPLDMAAMTEADFASWAIGQPGFEHWSANFADLFATLCENPAYSSWLPYAPEYAGYMAIGNAYYARTFEVPADFAKKDIMLSIGRVDDRCEVYINGVRVGSTGISAAGYSSGESAWESYSAYPVDSAVLKYGQTNTIIVRDINDGVGGGGWYSGPIGLYVGEAFNEVNPDGANDYFYEETFESEYAAKLLGKPSPYDNPYLIYLPQDYYETERYYPTIYLMHQYNSTHTSYRTDSIDKLFDKGTREKLFDEFIVVIPNSQEESWWYGDWQKMITEELIPHIDANYRTIDDARYRFTAGCSMGGQGAMAVALQNPNEFSGALSFFGAFSFGGNASPNYIAENESAEYLDNFALYFICGNQDIYSFGVPAIQLNQQLEKMGVDHYFFIENGGHDGAFYLPNFKAGVEYVWSKMYDDAVLEGGNPDNENKKPNLRSMAFAELLVTDEGVVPVFAVNDKIAEYYNLIPDSSYTGNQTPDLSIPLRITINQNGQKYQALLRDHKIAQGVNVNVLDALTDENLVLMSRSASTFDPTQKFTYKIEGAIFDHDWVELGAIPDDLLGDIDLPDTGDRSNAVLFALLLAASVGMLAMLAAKKRRA